MKSKIKTVEDAFKYTGRELSVLDAFENLPEQDKAYMVASYKRMVVIEALNKEANGGKNWTPDWSNSNEYKYYSWIWLKKNPAGVGFVVDDTNYDYTNTNTNVSSHLCEIILGADLASTAKNKKQMQVFSRAIEQDFIKQSKVMKRIANLYQQIISMENLQLADKKAMKGKLQQPGVKSHLLQSEANLLLLQEMLSNKSYKTSDYTTFKIYEPKEREIYCLPYFPDRITHHAIMNILEPIFVSSFISQTYSCVKGRGIHGASKAVTSALSDINGTQYCLKLDIKKFYPNINHEILKQLLRRKFKDNDLLWLLDEIIDSTDGLPIGNYLSQYFANFYLTYFDHWLKENKQVKYYFRYADDIVILSDSKQYLHTLLAEIKNYLTENLKLLVKENYQIFPVAIRGIDFVGYVFYHTHIRLRKRIKQNFARMLSKNKNQKSIASYNGWVAHCNSKNLMKKLLHEKV